MGLKWVSKVYEAYGEPNKTVDAYGMAILVAIAHCMNDQNCEAFPSTNTLAKMTHIARTTVFNRLSELKDAGVLEYDSGGYRNGAQWANTYRIHFPGEKAKIPPEDERSSVDFADVTSTYVRGQGVVRAAHGGSAYGARGVVRTADPNKNNKKEYNKNDNHTHSPSSFDIQIMGKSFSPKEQPETPVGRLMDFCRTTSQNDCVLFTRLLIKKGGRDCAKFTDDFLGKLYTERNTGKHKGVRNLVQYVAEKLDRCPDASDYHPTGGMI